jgi:hydroxyquinol 1,2-dioxygenase
MLDFNEHTITDAVIERFAGTPDPRLKAIMDSLVRHLHDFVRDVEPTFDEWMGAIQFLTRTGQMCSDTRQEFILLSDVLGVSMLVDAINHRQPEGATETTVLGPFYVDNPPVFADGAEIASADTAGERVYVEAALTAPDGTALAGAQVDVWQSDGDGYYDVQRPELSEANLRGRFVADAQGKVRFWSITPRYYPIPYDGPVGDLLKATKRHPYRPAHLHFMVSAAGFETLVTHVFVAGDPYLESDAVFGVKKSLIDAFPEQSPGVAPDGREMREPWRRLTYRFGLKRAETQIATTQQFASETVKAYK